MQIATVDIGGTHARFALADVGAHGIELLGEPAILRTADYAGLREAWQTWAATLGPTPPRAAIAAATSIRGELLKFTNNPWTIRRATLASDLGLEACTLVNDLEAVGHAVARAVPADLRHIAGPDHSLPARGLISVIGVGTGFGVAQLLRSDAGYQVLSAEGGHAGFAPVDEIDDAILVRLRREHGRVSTERVVSGPGLVAIYQTLAALEGSIAPVTDDKALWQAALNDGDALAVRALQRFCQCFGSAAGDIALIHGAAAVVLGGGMALRLRDRLAQAGFAQHFVAKGRFEPLMRGLPVKLIVHPQPGLYGAAAAFAREHA